MNQMEWIYNFQGVMFDRKPTRRQVIREILRNPTPKQRKGITSFCENGVLVLTKVRVFIKNRRKTRCVERFKVVFNPHLICAKEIYSRYEIDIMMEFPKGKNLDMTQHEIKKLLIKNCDRSSINDKLLSKAISNLVQLGLLGVIETDKKRYYLKYVYIL